MPIINQVVAGGGTTPTGTLTIVNNGQYNVTNYATADVQVPTSAPAHYIEKDVDANGMLNQSPLLINLNGVTGINQYVLAYAYYGAKFPANTALDLSNITQIEAYGCQSTFQASQNIKSVDLSGITTLSTARACVSMFASCNQLNTVDMSSLTTISAMYACDSMFTSCNYLQSLDLGSLTTVSGNGGCNNICNACTTLTTVNLGSLTTISNRAAFDSAFNGCKALPSLDLHSLTTISGDLGGLQNICQNCTSLASVDLSSLAYVVANQGLNGAFQKTCFTTMAFPSLVCLTGNRGVASCFNSNTALTSLSFPALTNNSFGSYTTQFTGMLSGCRNVTVHFPSNLQSVIGAWSDVTAGFGGTNTTVSYDLPATVILTGANGMEYQRNPKYDTVTALAWRVKDTGTNTSPIINWTPFYTSGLTDPTVGTTIYSDSSCTTAVTTVDSIA